MSHEKGKDPTLTALPRTGELSTSKRKMTPFHNLRLPNGGQHPRLRAFGAKSWCVTNELKDFMHKRKKMKEV